MLKNNEVVHVIETANLKLIILMALVSSRRNFLSFVYVSRAIQVGFRKNRKSILCLIELYICAFYRKSS